MVSMVMGKNMDMDMDMDMVNNRIIITNNYQYYQHEKFSNKGINMECC